MKRRRRLPDGRLAADPTVDDARALAMELAGLAPEQTIDPVQMRVVLEPGEHASRRLPGMWVRVQVDGQWSSAAAAELLVTSRRLIARLATGEVISLWWDSLVGFAPDLGGRHVVLDYGDGSPRLVSGPYAASVAVAGIAQLYGVEALTTHPSLEPLRRSPTAAAG